MSLDVVLVDYHTAWQQLCKKEAREQHKAALKEFGLDGIQRLQNAGSEVIKRSASASALLKVHGKLPGGADEEGGSAGAVDDVAAVRAMRRKQKVDEKVRLRVGQEERALRAQIKEEAGQREQLLTQLRQHRAAEATVVKQIGGHASQFKLDPEWKHKPMLPATKRTVVRVCGSCTGLKTYCMI
mmetsp:Transcript_122252/g.391083  ORF Transcript_122252/g.391083 Transcript_122252/m.391083 type:complete len:184 (+) Transcript_122252:57-608(+)